MGSVGLVDIEVGGKPLGMCRHRDCPALFDTGTSFLGGPTKATDRLLDHLLTDDDCSSAPVMTLVVRGDDDTPIRMDLTPEQYGFRVGDSCEPAVAPVGNIKHPPGLWIMGDTFLRSY